MSTYLMRMMPSGNHRLEITEWTISYCGKIDMNEKKYGNDKPEYDMDQVSDHDTAGAQEFMKNYIRI